MARIRGRRYLLLRQRSGSETDIRQDERRNKRYVHAAFAERALREEKEIKGATIVIKNSEGEVFLKYKSTGKAKEFYIPVGDYTLIEQIAPKGYQNLKTEVEFRVGTDGNIKLISAKSNMYKLIKSEEEQDNDLDHLIIYNNLKKVIVPNTGSTIAFLSIIGGIALIGGGGYAIYRRYKSI